MNNLQINLMNKKQVTRSLWLFLVFFISFSVNGQEVEIIEITNHLCEGDCIVIGEGLSTEYCYSWQEVDDIPWENPHNQSQTVCPTRDEVYEVVLTNEDGELVQIVRFVIQVSSNVVRIEPEHGFVCPLSDQTEILSFERPYLSSTWSTGEINTSVIEVNEAGDYSVTIVDEYGCEAVGTSEVEDLGLNEDEIDDFLLNNGFSCIPVKLVDFPTVNPPGFSPRTLTSNAFNDLVIIDAGAGEVNLTQAIDDFFSALDEDNLSSQAFLTVNPDFCSGLFADTEAQYDLSVNENFLTIWYHLIDIPNSDEDCLYVKQAYFIDDDTDLSVNVELPDPDIVDCSAGRRATIWADHFRALDMLEVAINKLDQYDGVSPREVAYCLDKYFPGYNGYYTLDNYGQRVRSQVKILRYMMVRFSRYRCLFTDPTADSCDGEYANAIRGGYNFMRATRICDPEYYSQSDIQRSETLIHEAAHAFLAVTDVYYDFEVEFDHLGVNDALNNSDSYSNFVLDLQNDSGPAFPIGTLTSLVYHEYSECPSAFSFSEDRQVFNDEPVSLMSFRHSATSPNSFSGVFYSNNGTQFVAVPQNYFFPFEYIGLEAAMQIYENGVASDEFGIGLDEAMLIGRKDDSYYLIDLPTLYDLYNESCDQSVLGSMRFNYKRTE